MGPVDLRARDYGVKNRVVMGWLRSLVREGGHFNTAADDVTKSHPSRTGSRSSHELCYTMLIVGGLLALHDTRRA